MRRPTHRDERGTKQRLAEIRDSIQRSLLDSPEDVDGREVLLMEGYDLLKRQENR